MRRDERPYDTSEGDDEIAAIESQWTRIWEQAGGPKGRADRVPRKAEFKIMWPYLQKLPKGSRVLDGGCGLGDWVVWLTRAGYPTVGLDVSRLTISKLQSMFPEMEFAVGDIRATGFAGGSFDAYFSWGTFEHFEEGFDGVVGEAFRVLKPGGLLFTSMPFVNLRHALRDILLEPWRLPPQSERRRFYQWRLTRAELAGILSRHGFAVEDVKIIGKRQGLQRFIQHAIGLSPTSTFVRGLALVLAPFVPKVVIGHMILAIARKPQGAT
ncbi:MAG TPA: class I SAM-dependent methyltransferase [Pseudolabrys sp.]|nr:class I SAM-dependent methyltransferase [Pseudolabrys sp.]